MERNYNSDNFEELLKESSDQYRMYPSETVWKTIYSALHTRRRWIGLGFLLLMLSAGFVTTIMVTNHNTTMASGQIEVIPPLPSSQTEETSTTIAKEPVIPILYSNKQSSYIPVRQNIPASLLTNNKKETNTNFFEEAVVKKWVMNKTKAGERIASPGHLPLLQIPDESSVQQPLLINVSDEATDQNLFAGISQAEEPVTALPTKIAATGSYPLSIESVINSYVKKRKRLSFQYYFTPTISYRKLSENKSYLRSSGYNPANTALYYNVNSVVTHKPDMGIEVGVAVRYAISNRLKLRAGLQFNTSRYDIKAFRSATEVTTIALNTGTFSADSVSTLSNYRNFNGYRSDWLHNLYFQVALPVGAEFQLAGDNRVKFGVGGTIQPTYVLGDKVYLISTNYKNYAEVPSLVRKWNVNTSFEAFVGYSTGRMNWQIGPQVRYQLLSSFVKKYPVKENLFDFGLKIGVSFNK